MLIGPVLSTKTLPEAIAFCRSVFKMFAASAVEDSKLPLTKTPFVGPDWVMFIVEAVWLGVIVRVAPTKASDVKVRVLAPTPTLAMKPRFVKVAIPFASVCAVAV
jgi:hypothetical protein